MKNFSIIFGMCLIILTRPTYGQIPKDDFTQKMDVSAITTGFLLNKGAFSNSQLESFRNNRVQEGKRISNSRPMEWKRLYNALRRSQLMIKR